jgi:hypothetical protein
MPSFVFRLLSGLPDDYTYDQRVAAVVLAIGATLTEAIAIVDRWYATANR